MEDIRAKIIKRNDVLVNESEALKTQIRELNIALNNETNFDNLNDNLTLQVQELREELRDTQVEYDAIRDKVQEFTSRFESNLNLTNQVDLSVESAYLQNFQNLTEQQQIQKIGELEEELDLVNQKIAPFINTEAQGEDE